MVADPIIYRDEPRFRVLDLRPDGVDCIPVLGYSNFLAVHQQYDYHYHPGCMEFCLCLKGNLTFETQEREYAFMPGHLFVSSPHEPHRLKHNPSGLRIYRILFAIPPAGHRVLGLDDKESEWLVRSLAHLPKRLFASTLRIKSAFERLFDLHDHASRRSPARRVRMKAVALDLLIAIIDAARRIPAHIPENISAIARTIRENPNADYPAAETARKANLSPSAFSDAFKRALGLPLHAYLLHCRVERAKRLLLKTDRSIGSIAQELRFYSAQHFAMTFKRIIGKSPQAFREEAGQVKAVRPATTQGRNRPARAKAKGRLRIGTPPQASAGRRAGRA